MKKVLIDTNIYLSCHERRCRVVQMLKGTDRIGFSAISIGELLSGFRGGRHEAKNRGELDLFLDSPRVAVHPVDEGSAEFYAAILNDLKAAGTPVPTNDMWIAAAAFQHGYQLFSRDRHFALIRGLVLFPTT